MGCLIFCLLIPLIFYLRLSGRQSQEKHKKVNNKKTQSFRMYWTVRTGSQWNLESQWSKTPGIHNVRISLSLCILTLKAFYLYQAARSGKKLTTKRFSVKWSLRMKTRRSYILQSIFNKVTLLLALFLKRFWEVFSLKKYFLRQTGMFFKYHKNCIRNYSKHP